MGSPTPNLPQSALTARESDASAPRPSLLLPISALLASLAAAASLWIVLGRYPESEALRTGLSVVGGILLATGAILGWVLAHIAASIARRRALTLAEDPSRSDEQKLLSRIIDSMEGGVMTLSPQGAITSLNAVARKTLEPDSRDLVGRPFDAVFPRVPQNDPLREMILAALKRHETFSSVEVNAATPGGTVALGLTLTPLRGRGSRPQGIVITFKDLAELQRLRAQVRRTDQLASLGRLSAGMAHEIRNPLGSLRGLTELIHDDLSEADPKRRYTATILRTIDHLNTLVESLLDFSQPPVNQLEPHDLRDIAHESLQFCSLEDLGRPVRLIEDYSADPVPVLADRESLARAVNNLLRNAFQATPAGGTVRVTVRRAPSLQDGQPDTATLAVTNTGSCIPPEDREKLFTPFFTTKSDGTGLGLPIANQIVSAHSGQIELRSDPSAGTSFIVVLPAASSQLAVSNQQ